MMEIRSQEINLECEINGIDRGSLKNLLVVKLVCKDFNINFDILENINIFKEKDKVKVFISNTKPSYTKDDFCAHGYVVTELKDGSSEQQKFSTIISLFGLLVKIMGKESFLKTYGLNVMDHVYFCVRKSNIS